MLTPVKYQLGFSKIWSFLTGHISDPLTPVFTTPLLPLSFPLPLHHSFFLPTPVSMHTSVSLSSYAAIHPSLYLHSSALTQSIRFLFPSCSSPHPSSSNLPHIFPGIPFALISLFPFHHLLNASLNPSFHFKYYSLHPSLNFLLSNSLCYPP